MSAKSLAAEFALIGKHRCLPPTCRTEGDSQSLLANRSTAVQQGNSVREQARSYEKRPVTRDVPVGRITRSVIRRDGYRFAPRHPTTAILLCSLLSALCSLLSALCSLLSAFTEVPGARRVPSGGRVEVLRRGASDMDVARGVKGQGRPLYADPRSDTGRREVFAKRRPGCRDETFGYFASFGKVTRPRGRNRRHPNTPKRRRNTGQNGG